VLADQRLNGFEWKRAAIHGTEHFLIGSVSYPRIIGGKDGKLKLITYYCDVCDIRSTYRDPAWCCQPRDHTRVAAIPKQR